MLIKKTNIQCYQTSIIRNLIKKKIPTICLPIKSDIKQMEINCYNVFGQIEWKNMVTKEGEKQLNIKPNLNHL